MEQALITKQNRTGRGIKAVYPYFAACGFVALVYVFMVALRGIYPFGKGSIASYDLSAQICPFIEHLFDALKGRSSLFYSHAIGGGADVFGSLAYFICSPFSVLFLVFGEGMVAEAAVLVLGLKLVVIALVGVWFASTMFKISPLARACLGILYAYCGYTFVANTYINWLDLLMYMPLIVWAFRRLVQTGRFWLFSILIAACIYTSFSIACFAMLTVYPLLCAYAFYNEGKGKRLRFIGRISIAFVCAVLMALPILVPSLIAYLRAARGGGIFDNLWNGFGENGFDTKWYLNEWANTLEAKLTYVLADGIMLVLTCVYFFRSKLKTGLSKFMLAAGVLTLLPTVVDESMQLLNMGSYMSYSLRFGFLNAIYFLGGACLGLDGLELFKKEERKGACLKRKRSTPIVYGVVFGGLFVVMCLFFGLNMHTRLSSLFADESISTAVKNFAPRFAHSIGGIFAIGIFFICVLLCLGVGAMLVHSKRLPIRLLSLLAVGFVLFQGVFFNGVLVNGNYSSQNIRTEEYSTIARTISEQDDGFYRVRDYGNRFSANVTFEGDTYAFTAFSSMLDKDNFPATTMFGYSGNGKNISRGNGGNVFGESFLGYKYVIIPEDSKSVADKRSWYKPVYVTVDGEQRQLQAGNFYAYENVAVFPNAFVVDSGEFRFVADNLTYDNRLKNQLALYYYLGGNENVQSLTSSRVSELSKKLWERGADIALSKGQISVTVTAREGQYLMVPFAAIDGYQVRVNGQETSLCDNDLKVLCVALQEGANKVEFTYESPYGEYVIWSSIIGVVTVCLMGIFLEEVRSLSTWEKAIGGMGVLLTAVVVAVFFVLPTGVFLFKCGTMLAGLF